MLVEGLLLPTANSPFRLVAIFRRIKVQLRVTVVEQSSGAEGTGSVVAR